MTFWLLLSVLLNIILCGCCIHLSNELNTEKIIRDIIKKGCEDCRYRKGGETNDK